MQLTVAATTCSQPIVQDCSKTESLAHLGYPTLSQDSLMRGVAVASLREAATAGTGPSRPGASSRHIVDVIKLGGAGVVLHRVSLQGMLAVKSPEQTQCQYQRGGELKSHDGSKFVFAQFL